MAKYKRIYEVETTYFRDDKIYLTMREFYTSAKKAAKAIVITTNLFNGEVKAENGAESTKGYYTDTNGDFAIASIRRELLF